MLLMDRKIHIFFLIALGYLGLATTVSSSSEVLLKATADGKLKKLIECIKSHDNDIFLSRVYPKLFAGIKI